MGESRGWTTGGTWRRITTDSTSLPPEHVTVTAQHIDDLFPVSAYWTRGDNGKPWWLRSIEGPDDGP